jgi:hypothetical protein
MAKPVRPDPDRLRLAHYYWEDARDYLKRYRVLFHNAEFDFQGIKSRRVKCYIDLRMALEAILKAGLCLKSKWSDGGEPLIKRIKGYSHNIGKLQAEALKGFKIDKAVLDAIARCDTAEIVLRYQVEAAAFREGDDRDYYATIGSDKWLDTIEAFVGDAATQIGKRLNKFSKPVDARTLIAKILGR